MMIASLLMKTRAGTVGLEGLHAAHVSPSSQIDCSLVHSVSPVLPITSLTKQQCMQSGCKHLIKLPLVTLVRAYVQGPEVQVGEDGPTGHSMCNTVKPMLGRWWLLPATVANIPPIKQAPGTQLMMTWRKPDSFRSTCAWLHGPGSQASTRAIALWMQMSTLYTIPHARTTTTTKTTA